VTARPFESRQAVNNGGLDREHQEKRAKAGLSLLTAVVDFKLDQGPVSHGPQPAPLTPPESGESFHPGAENTTCHRSFGGTVHRIHGLTDTEHKTRASSRQGRGK
jgi:hypothetical protein